MELNIMPVVAAPKELKALRYDGTLDMAMELLSKYTNIIYIQKIEDDNVTLVLHKNPLDLKRVINTTDFIVFENGYPSEVYDYNLFATKYQLISS